MRKYRNDITFVAVLLIFSLVCLLCMELFKNSGVYAVIEIDGKEQCRIPLNEDNSITIGENGKYNEIVIKNGAVYISDASCPDHLCIKQGEKSHSGETIICLPNKVIVTVVGGENVKIDAVAR